MGMNLIGTIFRYAYLFLALGPMLVSCDREAKGLSMETRNTYRVRSGESRDSILLKAAHVVPTENQYSALENEFIAFVHFGPNTFTRMEWGSGLEDPKVFDLKELDTDQWCSALRDAGMEMVILTVKHHDGFVLWQSRYTDHGVMSSDFRDGRGDILGELSESCKKYGLKLGVYLSPADLYQIEHPQGLYGNLSEPSIRTIPRAVPGRPFGNRTSFTFQVDDYNEYFLNQLFELLTEYGPIHEVWFDGAHPKRKGGQTYNYLAWKELIHTLAPEAAIFGKQDIRWCGNESGGTRDTEWNVIPYGEDPHRLQHFADLTEGDLGSREKLYGANFLHYQPAETNTSIREGWFYRDRNRQRVRSADDVFDIYERAVGGNSIFLLNIPPDRQGRFADSDVAVLQEVGRRIADTYGTDLFSGAQGPRDLLDGDTKTQMPLTGDQSIEISTPEAVTINRLVLQEAICTYGERIEDHVLEAWIEGRWQQIAQATNIGYKRILRFPALTSDRFRVRILASRAIPALASISAHYYTPRPPEIAISRNGEGLVVLAPKVQDFDWKPHGEDVSKHLQGDLEIRYTVDGAPPDKTSSLYAAPFELVSPGMIRAVAFTKEGPGPVSEKPLGLPKTGWTASLVDNAAMDHPDRLALDGDPGTYWLSPNTGEHQTFDIDLGKVQRLTAFTYTPPRDYSQGMIERGTLKISNDGRTWTLWDSFVFGNLVNDPSPRTHFVAQPVQARYVRLESRAIAGGHGQAAMAEIDFH